MYGKLPEVDLGNGAKAPGILIKIRRPAKTAVVRLPSPEELVDYLRAQKTIYRNQGRGKGQSEAVPNPKSDRELFDKIRLDKDGPKFDEYETASTLAQVTWHRIQAAEREGEGWKIGLETKFGNTMHVVEVPTERDLAIYRRKCYQATDLPHGAEERRFPPEAPMELYGAVIKRIEGYASTDPAAVPPHHKSAVVIELLNALEDSDDGAGETDPNS